LTVQGSLFDHVERRSLGDDAWLDLRSGWLTGTTACSTNSSVDPWRGRRDGGSRDHTLDVPRLVSFHDLGASRRHPPSPAAGPPQRHLRGRNGRPFTSAGLCLYRDGSDSVAWHGDTIGRSSTEGHHGGHRKPGRNRVFAMRPRGGGRSLRLPQCHGDLLVMGGSCQRTLEHSVPKTARPTGPRISIQYRPRDVR
jgi:alkylated DNA repair dioxygenase AlkB